MAYSIKGKGKFVARKRRHLRLRKKINGTPERPRLVVTRSNRHMVAQVIDDTVGHTLVSASDIEAELAGAEGTKTDKARKVGALIVIENKIRLNDVIATGTRVDGVISQPLIENIFEPNTPLHDGAVVVRGDRVIAAACLLRLSDTTGVGRDLGTRHRAGLGVSEISDAKVFIVSEETGIISMAEGGRLVRHLDEASLRQILHGIYDAQDKDARVPLLHFKQRRKGAHDEQQADKKA